jgi:hypothetical protein
MTADEYATLLEARIKNAAQKAVRETAREAENLMQTKLPVNRVKTHRAVESRMISLGRRPTALLGLRFNRVYPITEATPTARLFRRNWKMVRPIAERRLRANFLRHLKAEQ